MARGDQAEAVAQLSPRPDRVAGIETREQLLQHLRPGSLTLLMGPDGERRQRLSGWLNAVAGDHHAAVLSVYDLADEVHNSAGGWDSRSWDLALAQSSELVRAHLGEGRPVVVELPGGIQKDAALGYFSEVDDLQLLALPLSWEEQIRDHQNLELWEPMRVIEEQQVDIQWRQLRGGLQKGTDRAPVLTLNPALTDELYAGRDPWGNPTLELALLQDILTDAQRANSGLDELRRRRDSGELAGLLPEFSPAIGFDQRNHHHDLTLDEHIFAVVVNAQREGAPFEVQMAALLHDLGKPESCWLGDDGTAHYYANGDAEDHAVIGARKAHVVCRRLGLSAPETRRIVWLVREHMRPLPETARAARRLVAQRGPVLAYDLIDFRGYDHAGKSSSTIAARDVVPLQEQARRLVAEALG